MRLATAVASGARQAANTGPSRPSSSNADKKRVILCLFGMAALYHIRVWMDQNGKFFTGYC